MASHVKEENAVPADAEYHRYSMVNSKLHFKMQSKA